MIKVNLLKSFIDPGSSGNYAASAGSGDRDEVVVQAIKRIAIDILGPAALLFWESQNLPQLKKSLSNIQAEVAEIAADNATKSGLAAEIKKYEEEQSKINAQMNFILKIARDKSNEFKLFQHLQNSTPDSVWINRLEFKDNILLINTESDVSEDLNKFSINLSNTEFLTNISPTDQSVRIDPFGVGLNTTTQNLKAQFNSEVVGR